MPVTPVPVTDVRYTGVSGRPLPAVSWLVIVQPFQERSFEPVDAACRPPTPTPVVYWNCAVDQMTLIEVRRGPLGVEIQPVLRDRRPRSGSRR